VVRDGYIDVNNQSQYELRACLTRFGKYFTREGGYDQPVEYICNTSSFEGHLLADTYQKVIYGAVGFTPKCGTTQLDWVWLHPYFRRKNKFQQYWDVFLSKHANSSNQYRIIVRAPLSSAMKGFLEKQRHQGKIEADLESLHDDSSLLIVTKTLPPPAS
jgi:hypothetical protein